MKVAQGITAFWFAILVFGCINITDAKQKRIKKDNPPEKFFKGDDLKMAVAIYKNDIQTIDNLVKLEHFNVNGRGSMIIPSYSPTDTVRYTYLNYAVVIGGLPAAEKLLQLGADVNLVAVNGGGYNANINMACSNRNKETMQLLIRYKENLNPEFCDSPITDLLMGEVDKSLIELLLANGADINHQEYISGDMPVLTALSAYKFDYVNYFLDKGANPNRIDYNGNCLSYLIQKEIEGGRLADNGLKEFNQLKERMVNQYHVQYPLKNEYKKGLEESIKRYENLPQADKDFLGKDEMERIELFKKWLKNGTTDNGIRLN
ncbi:MAG: hypothetical protein J7539_03645 [Niabella sp.]|nr:hypothetical protein [Niabella sp.]